MPSARPSIFDDNFDLSGFTPRTDLEKDLVPQEIVRKVSEEGGFPSRSPAHPSPSPLKRTTLTKSGRTVLLNARVTQRAHDRFHGIVEDERLRYERGEIMHRPTLGEIVERALIALEREIAQAHDKQAQHSKEV